MDDCDLFIDDSPTIFRSTDFVVADAARYPDVVTVLTPYLEGHNGYIAGGCFKDILKNAPMRDIDIFFETQEDYVHGIEVYRSYGYQRTYNTENSSGFTKPMTGATIELICKDFMSPLNRLAQFDFTVCKFALRKSRTGHEVVFHPDYFAHLGAKQLIIDDSIVSPRNIFHRLIKYMSYGFVPVQETSQKILEAVLTVPFHEHIVGAVYA